MKENPAEQNPWAYREDFDGDESTGIRVWSGDNIICTMPGIGRTDYDNARLIAAAPELLEALQAAYPYVDNPTRRERIEVVIAKAITALLDAIDAIDEIEKAEQCDMGAMCIQCPAAPRKWVGLTDEEIDAVWQVQYDEDYGFVRAIEAKLKEVNK